MNDRLNVTKFCSSGRVLEDCAQGFCPPGPAPVFDTAAPGPVDVPVPIPVPHSTPVPDRVFVPQTPVAGPTADVFYDAVLVPTQVPQPSPVLELALGPTLVLDRLSVSGPECAPAISRELFPKPLPDKIPTD